MNELPLSCGHLVCFAEINIVGKNYGTNWIFGSKKTLRSLRSLGDAALSSLRSSPSFNSNYAESPSARDISQIV